MRLHGRPGAAEVRTLRADTMPIAQDSSRHVVSAFEADRGLAPIRNRDRRRPPPSKPSPTLPTHGARSACCRHRRSWSSSASSTNRAACSSCCTRRSGAASTRHGVWRFASASAASSTSNCRRRRPRTRCCSRSARSIRFRSPTSSGICTRPPRATCWSRHSSTRRCFRRAGGGTRRSRSPFRATAAAGRSRRSSSGRWPTI